MNARILDFTPSVCSRFRELLRGSWWGGVKVLLWCENDCGRCGSLCDCRCEFERSDGRWCDCLRDVW